MAMPRWTEDQWVAEGKNIILDILAQQDAALWPEIVARASEGRWADYRRVDANHMVTARNILFGDGEIEKSLDPARGRRAWIDAYHLPIEKGKNETRINRAAGRKRLLYARWFGWAVGDAKYPSGFIGVGGERVVRASLAAAAPHLYFPVQPGFGEVTYVFGDRVVGSLDSGAWMVPRPGGITGAPMFVPIEVKNVREWIFPRSHQLYQLLAKAAALQVAHPEQRLVPLLVCRRKHIQTLFMGNDLGFMVVEVKRQFMLPSNEYTEEDVQEVRAGLGFDIEATDQPDNRVLVPVLNGTLPVIADRLADRWRSHGSMFLPLYRTLADDKVAEDDRAIALDQLRVGAGQLGDIEGGW